MANLVHRAADLVDRARAHTWRISSADRAAWDTPTTLAALGDVTARWLERAVRTQPAWGDPGDGPDPETVEPAHDYPDGLVPVLARINRGGFVTRESQPGVPLSPGFDGAMWQLRASVTGFVGRDLGLALWNLARDRGLYVAWKQGPQPRWIPRRDMIVTGERAGRISGSALVAPTRRWIRGPLGYPGCNDTMVDVLCASDWVTLVDPVFGRNTLLWPALDDLIASRTT